MEKSFWKSTLFMVRSTAVGGLLIWLLVGLAFPSFTLYADIPVRPEGTGTTETAEDAVNGGQIQLNVTDAAGGEWTAIEWQDPYTGEWTMVDGWRGDLASGGEQVWWVGKDSLGDGPFRWLVYNEEGGDLLATSVEFYLPASNGFVTIVTMTLSE